MCEPVSIAMAVVGALSAVAGHQQAEVAAKVQTKQHEQNQRNAQAALRDSYIAIQNRQQQEAESAAQQVEERRRESVRQMSSAYAAAGEAGVSGFSVQSILADIGATAARDISTIEQNRDWSLDQLNSEMSGARNQAMSQMNATTAGVRPSGWATALQIGSSAVGAYASYATRTGKDPVGDFFGKKTATTTNTTPKT
ncbi:hypothetical protein GR140_09920 [Pseudomonas putida]|uniref:virion core protein, T7 gp14 family n=1 Tax=Pseudomonas putida TaxID=303 RepID=UPI001BB0CF82|nr:hypothetical protein [Pseudomonas putida]QUG89066.1 hypothetical protein GR140_09920 [Pseudomonas putida]